MRSAFLLLCSCLAFMSLSAQDDVLLTIGNQKILVSAFERAYTKNLNVNTSEKQSVEDYFTLYLKFRLKVAAALDNKMDTMSSFKQEYKSYRDQLAKSYLTDNEALERLLQETYYRTVNEVKVSHIMVRLSEKATPADTLNAYHKILAYGQKIEAGESFENVAVQFSDDPSAKTNQGNLGYFSAFRFPYSFENVCYQTAVGKISAPVRTRYGYHLIKVYDKRLSPGEIKVAHIMLAIPQDASQDKWNEAKQKIISLANQINQGQDFGKLAQDVSDDHNSAKNKGELPWFGSGRMVSEFEDAAFALNNPGDISIPVKTYFGWHIIKLLEKRPVASYNSLKNDLKSNILRNERGEGIAVSFLQKLRKDHEYREYPENLSCFLSSDSSVYKGNYDQIPISSLKLPVFSIQKQNYTVDNFRQYLKKHKTPEKQTTVSEFISNAFSTYAKTALITYEDEHLEEKYADFKNLTEEYYDGILLFNIMDHEVWGKATRDSVGLEHFFGQISYKYAWDQRLDATIYKFNDKVTGEKAREILKHKPSLTAAQLTKLCCDTLMKSNCVTADHSLFSKGDNELIDSIGWKKGLTKVFNHTGASYIIAINGKIKSCPKKLNEVRGLVTAEYQNLLEEKWLTELNTKYKVVVNQELLHKIALKYKSNH